MELIPLQDDVPPIQYSGEYLQKIGVLTFVIKKMSAYNNQIAGYPDDAERYIATGMDFNEYVVGNNYWETFFYLWAGGNSMKGDGIYKGDLLVVDKLRDHNEDSIIVFYINREFTLKRIEYYDDRYELVSSNKEMESIIVKPDDELERWGVLVNVIKKF